MAERSKVQIMADLYNLTFYIRDDGSVSQYPPGEPIRPVNVTKTAPHGAQKDADASG
jgi:hypothetical protein